MERLARRKWLWMCRKPAWTVPSVRAPSPRARSRCTQRTATERRLTVHQGAQSQVRGRNSSQLLSLHLFISLVFSEVLPHRPLVLPQCL